MEGREGERERRKGGQGWNRKKGGIRRGRRVKRECKERMMEKKKQKDGKKVKKREDKGE